MELIEYSSVPARNLNAPMAAHPAGSQSRSVATLVGPDHGVLLVVQQAGEAMRVPLRGTLADSC